MEGTTATAAEEEVYERINQSQHIDVLTSSAHKGKYWYVVSDIELERPYVGIDKTGEEFRSETFAEKHELWHWFKHDPATGETSVTPVLVDPNDPMAILQQAQGEADEAFGVKPFADPAHVFDSPGAIIDAIVDDSAGFVDSFKEVTAVDPADPLEMPLDLLTGELAVAEQRFIQYTQAANEVEARYKQKLNDFNIGNAELLAEKKISQERAGKAEEAMSGLLVAWSTITGDNKYDEYLATVRSVEYDIDMAAATEWARENYKAAINEVVNEKMIIDYVKKSDKPLAFVKATPVIKPRISRKF